VRVFILVRMTLVSDDKSVYASVNSLILGRPAKCEEAAWGKGHYWRNGVYDRRSTAGM
jgi:hypothetical protein